MTLEPGLYLDPQLGHVFDVLDVGEWTVRVLDVSAGEERVVNRALFEKEMWPL